MRYGHPRGSIILALEAIPFKRLAGDGVKLDVIARGEGEVHGHDAIATLLRQEGMSVVAVMIADMLLPIDGST